MKKIVTVIILTVAMFIVSGCGLANGHGEDSVPISDLKKGYIVDIVYGQNKGYDIHFYHDKFALEEYLDENNSKYYSGTYKYNGTSIVFRQNKPNSDSYQLYIGDKKSIELQDKYTLDKDNIGEVTIGNIAKKSSPSLNYACKK